MLQNVDCQSLYKGHSLHEALNIVLKFLPNTYSCSTLIFESPIQRGQHLYIQYRLSHAVSLIHRFELPPG